MSISSSSLPKKKMREIRGKSFSLHQADSTPLLNGGEDASQNVSVCGAPVVAVVAPLESKARISRSFDEGTRIAVRKLVKAVIVCVIFMILEVVCGILSNSLALLTDASHLFSDMSSYFISLFALWVSTFKGNSKMSFGYHRAEIIGALLSVMFIWVLTGILVYTAILRISHQLPVNGMLMFITACFGTLVNLFITYILGVHTHGLGGHKDCHGSHDHGSHTHSHSHSNSTCHHSERKGHTHDTESTHTIDQHPYTHTYEQDIDGATTSEDYQPQYSYLSEKYGNASHHNRIPTDTQSVPSLPLLTKSATPTHRYTTLSGVSEMRAYMGSCNALQEYNDQNPSHKDFHRTGLCSEAYSEDVEVQRHTMRVHEHASLSLKAAYIHSLGDLIQNVGVMIAAVIIWIKPEWSIADPLCTLLFSVLVLATTFSIIREALNVLMEGTPVGIDFSTLHSDLLRIDGVIEVHDLHVWSLTVGEPALACHLVVDNEGSASTILREATSLCQNAHGILHTTIQLDLLAKTNSCDTRAHLRCVMY